MTILEAHEIERLDSILHTIKYLSREQEDIQEEAEWLERFLADQPIRQLHNELISEISKRNEAENALLALQRDFQVAKDGIESLKHLQKYEGHQKAESDKIGHEAEVRILKEEIERLGFELRSLRDAQR